MMFPWERTSVHNVEVNLFCSLAVCCIRHIKSMRCGLLKHCESNRAAVSEMMRFGDD